MITNDEALDYIAMNDLENAYDAERDAISAHVRQLRSFRFFGYSELYEDELPYY
jgi:hypothetical protein